MYAQSSNSNFQQKTQFSCKHDCKLDLSDDLWMPRLAPFAPFYRKWIYNFQKRMLISRYHPFTSQYFRSSAAILKEKKRHLITRRFRFIIHPLSTLAMLREICMIILWLVILYIDPLFESIFIDFTHGLQDLYEFERFIRITVNSLLLLGSIANFFIGFIHQQTNKIILEPKSIAHHYLSTYFVFDFVPCVWGFFLDGLDHNSVDKFRISLSAVPVLFLRSVRLKTLIDYIANTMLFLKFRETTIVCMSVSVIGVFIIHPLACCLCFFPAYAVHLEYEMKDSWVAKLLENKDITTMNRYLRCLMVTVCHFYGVHMENQQFHNSLEQLILAFITLLGYCYNICIIALLLQLFGTINISKSKYEQIIQQLDEYMVMMHLPPSTRNRLINYYEYRFQGHFFLEHMILSSLSEHLRYEVMLYSCRNLIKTVNLLQVSTKEVIGTIVGMLHHEIYLPGDVLLKQDQTNDNFYFILYGTVSGYDSRVGELFHMEDGSNFGECSLLTGSNPALNLVAVEITEVYYLTNKEFLYVMEKFPDIYEHLKKVMLLKIRLYEEMCASRLDVKEVNVLSQLRRGEILEKRRLRN